MDLDFDFNDYEDIDQVATKEKRVYFDLEESFKRLKQKMRMPEKNESIRTISPAGGWSSCSLLMYLANEEVIDELFITTLRVGKKEMAALTDLIEQGRIKKCKIVLCDISKENTRNGKKYDYFIDSRKETTVLEDRKPDIKKMKKDEMAKLLEEIYSDKVSTTIINEDKPAVNDLHPTMKPIKLMGRLIKNSSKQGEKVLDLFGGSGSTLIACEQLGRDCYTMEYDPKYADVIIDRYERLTGEKAKKIEG